MFEEVGTVANKTYVLNRNITVQGCGVSIHLKKGETVYPYDGYTYSLISSGGVAFSMKEGEAPFFELPRDAVDLVPTA